MGTYLHVTSSRNRSSIRRHGLDWTRMGAAPGIAGSRSPEAEGCFLCANEFDGQWFVDMNNTGGPVDVWEVSGVDARELVESPNGFMYLPRKVGVEDLLLVRQDIPAPGGTVPG